MNHSTLRRVALTLGTLALGLGTLVGATSSATALEAAAAPVRPAVGDCHTLSYQEYLGVSESDPAVACSTKHTSRTIHVSDLPASVDPDSYVQVARVVDERCDPAFNKIVKGTTKTRLLTASAIAFFQPSEAERQEGANWIRCDIVLLAGKKLAPLPPDAKLAIGKGKIPDRIAKCRVVLSKRYYTTPCTKSHATRAKGSFTLPGTKFPSAEAQYRAAEKKCPKITGSTKKWTFFGPSEDAWKSGFRFFTCDLVTKH